MRDLIVYHDTIIAKVKGTSLSQGVFVASTEVLENWVLRIEVIALVQLLQSFMIIRAFGEEKP